MITVERKMPKTEVWRAIVLGAAFFKGDCGKICIAINDDIDPDNADALLWAMAYRMNPVEDVQTLRHRGQGHGPKRETDAEEDSNPIDGRDREGGYATVQHSQRKSIWRKLNVLGMNMGLPKIKTFNLLGLVIH
jgi:4-hydroxy-3-polyprenylbenzoate decarboxylase